MKIKKNKIVSFNYSILDDNGTLLDSSKDFPMPIIFGKNQLLPKLEAEMNGKAAGDNFKLTIAPEDAYGNYREELVQAVPLSGFQDDGELTEGMQVQVQTGEGLAVARVTKIDGEDVTLDLNHPFADKTLHFKIEIMDVRDASKTELDHGHVHGPGGHHH